MKRNLAGPMFLAAAAALVESAAAQHSHGEEAGEEVDCGGTQEGDYNLNLAIVSVFVMWVVSFLGAAFPALLALKRHPYLIMAIKLGSFAGTGVLLATGFVHMLLAANENLSSPCLSETWLSSYPSWGSLFAVITIIFMQVLDYVLAAVIERQKVAADGSAEEESSASTPPPSIAPQSLEMSPSGSDLERGSPATQEDAAAADSDGPTECNQHSKCKDHDCNGRTLLPGPEAEPELPTDCNKHVVCNDNDCNGRTLLPVPESETNTRVVSSLIISEISICSHSILIGLTLGMTGSSEFTALFIAIVFHQLLEGVALGSNASEAGLSTKKILLLAITYAFSTPTGIAIGIGVRQSLNLNSTGMLLSTGILDAVAAGTLIFLALGDHMNALRSQQGWLRKQTILVQLMCFGAFFLGAAILLTLALWA